MPSSGQASLAKQRENIEESRIILFDHVALILKIIISHTIQSGTNKM
jgi:hypothetical protein